MCSREVPLALSLGMLCVCPQLAQAALSFNQGASAITYQHDVIQGGEINREKVQSSETTPRVQTPSTVTFVLPDLTLTGSADGVGTLKSRAKIGMAQNATSTLGTGVFKSGSLLTQSDPGNLSSAFSTLEVGFNLVWDVTAPGFGPPIIGSFSVPLLAVVGAGGSATAEIIDLHWERFDGTTTTDLRAPASNAITFLPGSTLTTLTIPGAAFSPSGLTTGDQFIVRGTMKLAVKNADDPVSITIDPDYQESILDDGAVVQYRFDDGPIGSSPPLLAIDTAPAGGSSDAVYNGLSVLVPGLRGAALRPNGNQMVATIFPSAADFTAELWASSANTTWNTDGWLVTSTTPTASNGFAIHPIFGTTMVEAFVHADDGTRFSVGILDVGAFDITQLHQYVLTFDSATGLARLYFDGAQVLESDLGSIIRASGVNMQILLGAGTVEGNLGNGVIDEFAYYETALRPEVVMSHFQMGISIPDRFTRIIGAQVIDTDGFAVPEPATAGLIGLAMMGLLRAATPSLSQQLPAWVRFDWRAVPVTRR